MVSNDIRLRGEFLNIQVITRNTGKKLGIVKDVLIDIDRREVVILGLKDNLLAFSGLPKYMYFSNIQQTGDVVLVEDEDVIEDIDILPYSTLINSEVITETGEPLGRVRDFQFSVEDGKVYSIIIASIGLPQIPEQLVSTYEIAMEEVVSSGPNRLILFEGAQERLRQLSVGVLERLGLGRPPWEKDNEDVYYAPTARPENQLGTGIPLKTPVETRQPVLEEVWEDEAEPLPPKRTRAMRYEDYEKPEPKNRQAYKTPAYEDVDVWQDEVEDDDYTPPKVNLEQKQKERKFEYEE
jgi:sporulation protein YlmC with PRC-barrel domain